ncbi:MAG: GntR family transcriptional regulator, negative regulator for fad regulon and positive regulator of [Chloroflexota bacterium]|nr:GntR family transcriptional regulator, negative regulator for fad regulon and positive regulator of [Chloroflexota bacterium]
MQPENWQPPLKPGEITESRLIHAILDGTFPINSFLPGERELAAQLGVTRPTLREVMQRLERDGWLEIRHGKPTRVRDFWKEGGLGVSIALAQYQSPLPQDFVANLLEVRVLLAPTYTEQAVRRAPREIGAYLQDAQALPETAAAFSAYDWQLHWLLTVHSGNTFFTHFMNSVQRLYALMGEQYFTLPQNRSHSRGFYSALSERVQANDAAGAGLLAGRIMTESRDHWIALSKEMKG